MYDFYHKTQFYILLVPVRFSLHFNLFSSFYVFSPSESRAPANSGNQLSYVEDMLYLHKVFWYRNPYHTCPKIWTPIFILAQIYLELLRVANGVDPDQMLQNAASDLGLHCL